MTRAPLRVAHVVATAGRSGVESHLTALIPAFDPGEVQARLFVPGPGPLVETLARHGVTAESGAPTRKLAWADARALADRLRGQCDVLHAHGPRAAFWAAGVARTAGIPRFVCTVHELRWRTLPPGLKRECWVALEAWALGRADALIVLSHDSEARVRARYPEWGDRLWLVPSSTMLLHDTDLLPPARSLANEGPLHIVTIGRLQWVKRHDRVLDAVARCVQRGRDVELHIGGDGELDGALRGHARSLGIAERVHWLGGTFDVPALLASGHVFVTASISETFGIAALEAMAIGLPVVTCDNGGVSELVIDGACGTVVRATSDPGAAEGIADAISALASDPARRAAWGMAAARRARESFSPTVMARATTAVYRDAPR